MSVQANKKSPSAKIPPITFTDRDLVGVVMPHDDAIVIKAIIANTDVKHFLID